MVLTLISQGQEEPSAIARLLCERSWRLDKWFRLWFRGFRHENRPRNWIWPRLPTQRGEVVAINLAWLPGEELKEQEERFNFDASVSSFSKARQKTHVFCQVMNRCVHHKRWSRSKLLLWFPPWMHANPYKSWDIPWTIAINRVRLTVRRNSSISRTGDSDSLVVFLQAWPSLGVETFPSAATLIAIVKHLRSKDEISAWVGWMENRFISPSPSYCSWYRLWGSWAR